MNVWTCGLLVLLAIAPAPVAGEGWFSGVWDSRLHLWSTPKHPTTVALRVEVIDAETLIPVPGAELSLTGSHLIEQLGRADDSSIPRVQVREFERTTRSSDDGVAVFALSWQKEFPWSTERPRIADSRGGWTEAQSWIRPIDDIEKANRLQVRHPLYTGKHLNLNFDHLLRFGQDGRGELQDPSLFDRFEQAWRAEVANPAVRFCALRLGAGFGEFGKRECERPEFFEQIRKKEFGLIYPDVGRFSIPPGDREEWCGPFFVYMLQIGLVRTRAQAVAIERSEVRSRFIEERESTPSPDNIRSETRQPERSELRRNSAPVPSPVVSAFPQPEGPATEEPRRQVLARSSIEALTPALIREKGLFLGTRGILLNEALGNLPEGIVIEAVAHRAIASEAEFHAALKNEKAGQVPVQIWKRNPRGGWERAETILRIER